MHKMLNFLEHHDRITVIMRLTCKKGSRPSHPLILTTCKLWFFPKLWLIKPCKKLQQLAETLKMTEASAVKCSYLIIFSN